MSRAFPEPSSATATADLLVRYLDFYRESVIAKLDGLDADQLRMRVLPSGWTPIELLAHLVFMERRWFVWGFLGEDVPDPWGDNRDGLREAEWHVPADRSAADLVAELRAGGRRTAEIVGDHRLDEHAPPGPRFTEGPPASLLWICLHVINEYARHLGHLDAVRELIDGETGE